MWSLRFFRRYSHSFALTPDTTAGKAPVAETESHRLYGASVSGGAAAEDQYILLLCPKGKSNSNA